MSVPVYIGDEVNASGYRLAGLRIRVPMKDELLDVISSACSDAPLVLISAGMARELPAAQLETVLARVTPPVVMVPDIQGHTELTDVAVRMRQQLGVLE